MPTPTGRCAASARLMASSASGAGPGPRAAAGGDRHPRCRCRDGAVAPADGGTIARTLAMGVLAALLLAVLRRQFRADRARVTRGARERFALAAAGPMKASWIDVTRQRTRGAARNPRTASRTRHAAARTWFTTIRLYPTTRPRRHAMRDHMRRTPVYEGVRVRTAMRGAGEVRGLAFAMPPASRCAWFGYRHRRAGGRRRDEVVEERYAGDTASTGGHCGHQTDARSSPTAFTSCSAWRRTPRW
jgi:hypothetical protein